MVNRRPIFLKHHRLAESLADGIMLAHPLAAPGILVSPGLGVEMEGTAHPLDKYHLVGEEGGIPIIQCLNLQIPDKIHPLRTVIRIRPISLRRTQPALIPKGNHMPSIQPLNEPTHPLRPFIYHPSVTPFTARLITQLPRKNRRRVFVPVDNELDVPPVRALAERISIPARGVTAEGSAVDVNPAEIVPVVH